MTTEGFKPGDGDFSHGDAGKAARSADETI